jgi:hypothetical protein
MWFDTQVRPAADVAITLVVEVASLFPGLEQQCLAGMIGDPHQVRSLAIQLVLALPEDAPGFDHLTH